MHEYSTPHYLLNEQDERFVKIDCLSFKKPNYQKLKHTHFWDMGHCLDVLSHIKAASQVYDFMIAKRHIFIESNSLDNQLDTKKIKDFELESFEINRWNGPLENMKMDLDFKSEKENTVGRFLKSPSSPLHSFSIQPNFLDVPHKDIIRLDKIFDEEYPEISPAFQYLQKCLGDIKDLFKTKGFIAVENEFEMDKCEPLKFLGWAKEKGYVIPSELAIIEDEGGKIKWLDPITHGNLEQTFPKHPTGKDLKDDPLYVAVKVREAFMRGDIPESRRYRTSKQRLQKYVDDKYKDIISQTKRNDIVSLVNDGAGHGGDRKK
jgi:hypothetical protein